MVPFTPRLIPAILPNLAHHVAMIQSAAIRTNKLLFGVIQKLPSPQDPFQPPQPPKSAPERDRSNTTSKLPRSPTPTSNTRQGTLQSLPPKDVPSPDPSAEGSSSSSSQLPTPRPRSSTADFSMAPRPAPPAEILPPVASSSSRPHSPASLSSLTGPPNGNLSTSPVAEESDPFDYQRTVNELTIQFLSEFEETRVAALKWLIMLHQKAPKKVRVR